MDDFRKRLDEARQKNVDGRWYLPRHVINEITDRDTVSQIIRQNNLPNDESDPIYARSQQRDLELNILIQAKVAFAVSCYVERKCICNIPRLINHAGRKARTADHHLPFLTHRELQACGFSHEDADHFLATQWHFTAPEIRLGSVSPVVFESEVILPFQNPKGEQRQPPDTGAFGFVNEICVDKGHQSEPIYSSRTVRKQFYPDTPKKASQRELRNLCILSSARHENILRLLFAYRQDDCINFIFPLASHGTLDQMFQSDAPSSWPIMESEQSLVTAISGLASAIATMHEFTPESISVIGCHRDLKPSNILIDGNRMLLADFGLSRIADSQETTSSSASNLAGDFIAPEHEDRDFSRNRIGRPSDIWAFGCVTLMLLVYFQSGRQGIERLESKRRVQWPQFVHQYFHDYDKPNSGLEESLQELASSPRASTRGLLYLVQKMLVLDKTRRPKAREADAYIRCLVIHMWSKSIEEELIKVCRSDFTHVHYERARFKGWQAAIALDESDFPEFKVGVASQAFGRFQTVVEHLSELHSNLAGFNDGRMNEERKAFLPVKSRIDRLVEALDKNTKGTALAHTDRIILESRKLFWLEDLQQLFEETSDRRIESKIITRRHILRPSSSGRLHVNFSTLEPRPQRDKLSEVRTSSENRELILAEETHTMSYTSDPQRLPSRLVETANLLSKASTAEGSFHVLRCRGYYHCPTERRSGLLYHLPGEERKESLKIITFKEILKATPTTWFLEDRFRLAHGLATAIYNLHCVGWLHRNVSASNIVFFDTKQMDPENRGTTDPKAFYFVGFAQSRADRDFTDSDGPADGTLDEEHYYQHPDYLSHKKGYQMQHDYYSLGILLLEIGLWQPFLSVAAQAKSPNIRDPMDLALRLGLMMGSHYQDAVKACLDGTLSAATSSSQQERQVLPRFWEKVVDQLSPDDCRA